jgi:FkbM family methyltransferase
MLLFDIGANKGDAVLAGLKKGYKVVALEAAPKVYGQLVSNFIYNPNVIPLRFAVSETNNERIEFYEAEEDGLSSLEKTWLTDPSMPYNGKPFRTVQAVTCTIDWLADTYGEPDLIKIDVEGAEWQVLRGMTKYYGKLAFEWTLETLSQHEKQLNYLYSLGYRDVAPQYIENHLDEPTEWFGLSEDNTNKLLAWHQDNSDAWIDGGWTKANLRPTADVGMLWVR